MPPHPHSSSYHSPSSIPLLTRRALLDWFDGVREQRAMPWRKRLGKGEVRSREEAGQRAYEVMISEVMLQQTQVATVIAYFQRWIQAFPTIHALSLSTSERVHALWTGLGYYSRATRLLQAAQKVVADYDGILPSDPAVLQKEIPGVGPYTAGAIASIAYGVKAPVVDGNVNRVLARLLGVYADPAKKAATTLMWDIAGELVPEDRPGDWNEALMELGATICKPTEALCSSCPLSASCRAFAESSSSALPTEPEQDIEDLCTLCSPLPSAPSGPTAYPMKAIKKKAREEDTAVCIVEWRPSPTSSKEDSRFLLIKRPDKGLLASLLEFPSLTLPSSTVSPHNPSPLLPPFLAFLLPLSLSSPPTLSALTPHGEVGHTFSHIQMTYHVSHFVFFGEEAPENVDSVRGRWVSRAECEEGVGMGKGSGGKCWEVFTGGGKKNRPAHAKRVKKQEDGDSDEGPRKKVMKKKKVGGEREKGQGTLSGFFKKKEVPAAVQEDTKPEPVKGDGEDKPTIPPKKMAWTGKGGKKFVILSDDEEDDA